MHDRVVVVRADVVTIGDVLVEVVRALLLDVGPVYGHERVAVLTTLFVPEADAVTDFVNRRSGLAALGECDVLPVSPHADG
jgi:hypothetical protein